MFSGLSTPIQVRGDREARAYFHLFIYIFWLGAEFPLVTSIQLTITIECWIMTPLRLHWSEYRENQHATNQLSFIYFFFYIFWNVFPQLYDLHREKKENPLQMTTKTEMTRGNHIKRWHRLCTEQHLVRCSVQCVRNIHSAIIHSQFSIKSHLPQ